MSHTVLNDDTFLTHSLLIESYIELCMICSKIFVPYFIGILSHQLRNHTHLGKYIAYYLRFIPGHAFGSQTPSSPVYRLEGP